MFDLFVVDIMDILFHHLAQMSGMREHVGRIHLPDIHARIQNTQRMPR